jgi:hypothetical protein
MSIVGAPMDMQFEVSKARSRVKIRVSPADAPPPDAFVDGEGDREVRGEASGEGGVEEEVRSSSEKTSKCQRRYSFRWCILCRMGVWSGR